MNTTTSDFAAEIAPYFARTLRMGLNQADALEAAALLWKDDTDRDFSRRIGMTDHLAAAMMVRAGA
jgi:hypothetical protein